MRPSFPHLIFAVLMAGAPPACAAGDALPAKPRPAGEAAAQPAEGDDSDWWKRTGNPRGQWWLTAPRYQGAAADEIWERVPIPPSPVLSPDQALDSFVLDDRFRIELVAAEPLVVRPVFMRFDAAARLWVVEMPGYMRDIDGSGESDPSGRVVVLEDVDGDGRMDQATTFMDGLVMPRTLAFVEGGVLVVEPPKIWYAQDTDGDLVADERTLVADDYGEYGNPEHSANGLLPAMDNWMYSAKSAVRYRFKDRRLESEPTVFRGQWGISQDDMGRLYYNYNASPLHTELVPGQYLMPAGGLDLSRPQNVRGHPLANVSVVEDKSLHPVRVAPLVTLGASDLRPDGTLAVFTAASAPYIYRGDLFSDTFRGDAFVCDPVGNLIARFELEADGLERVGSRAYPDREFLASTDERFRPVFLESGPDGALYVTDMYTGIVEHKKYVTEYLRNQVLSRGMGDFTETGRIYRIVPADAARCPPVRLDVMSGDQLVEHLSSENGWLRDTAQRLLVERGDTTVTGLLRRVVREGRGPLGRMHALWTWDGLGGAEAGTVRMALRDPDPRVRATALRLSEGLLTDAGSQWVGAYERLATDPDPEVRMQLMLSLGRTTLDWAERLMAELLVRHDDGWLVPAAAAGLTGREVAFIERLFDLPGEDRPAGSLVTLLEQLGLSIFQQRDPAALATLLQFLGTWPRDDARVAAVLRGATTLKPKGKPLRLAEQPPLVAALAGSADSDQRALGEALHAHLTWPGDLRKQQATVTPLTTEEQGLFDLGRTQYTSICAACHQPNGQGLAGVAPSLVDARWVTGPAPVPINIVLHGLIGPIMVNGETWDMAMPGFGTVGGPMNDENIAAVLTYIRRAWGNEASPVTLSEVAAERERTADRNQPWKAAELEPLLRDGNAGS